MRFFMFMAFAFLVMPIGTTAQGSTSEVDVVIKSVDAKGRSITAEYTVKDEKKSIDLDVSRKAEISVNGKDTKLDAVKSGQTAKIVYDKDLQIVTKLDATGTGEVYRFTVQLSEFGDGKIQIEKTAEPPKEDFEGELFTFSTMPHAKAIKGKNGMFRVVHDFSDSNDLKESFFERRNISSDENSLVFTPGPMEKDNDVKKASKLVYGKKLGLPLIASFDVVKYGGEHLTIDIYDPPRKFGTLHFQLWAKDANLENPINLSAIWLENDKEGKRHGTDVFKEENIRLSERFEKKFRLPLPNAKISELFFLQISTIDGAKPTTISRLEVQGRLAPMFGMQLAEKQGKVFVGGLLPNSLGGKAGVQPGDVVLAINGKKPKDTLDATNLLGKLPVGEEAVIKVQRGENVKELHVTAE